MRASEFRAEGVTGATVKRLVSSGQVEKVARGLYSLPDPATDFRHTLGASAKLVPNGVVCLDTALSFHDLTDRMPRQIWLAISARDWRPIIHALPVAIIRFNDRVFSEGIETHEIDRVPVRIYGPAKTVSDLFFHGLRQKRWYESDIGVAEAVQAMKEALNRRKATPAEIAGYAERAGIWDSVRPYLEALVANS
ncbi:type IV toxin-antitoxin system AbiEi family antitoxin domain-containing protein [Rhodoplanes roseus]|uniref:AbiEi antitoxin N-terminal domain-containing protein n=1 Tax=Rhodoplanes roseus TaxID=29409 RepID=A0A327KJI8_9BRAD|nr:type IV toxin-antitoxin system AbiEi family antitoxin domain-containing protein [Rhodoplanes roseus]RAI37655.1 hypothetical protein CH341_29265 [Rhodoplanes roseus]